MSKNFFNDDDENLNNDDFLPSDNIFWIDYVEISSIDNLQILQLIPKLIKMTIYSFKIRYLSSINDFNLLYNLSRIELYNYIYDEFNHMLLSENFLIIKQSNISIQDLNNIYISILEAVEFLINNQINNE